MFTNKNVVDLSHPKLYLILIGSVHIAHQSINLDISAGLATPLPNLCCQWSLLRHCNHHSMQCFVIQDTLRNSSFDHQNNISISKENYPRHILISKNLFSHRYHFLQPNTQLRSPIVFHPCWLQGPHFTLQHLFNSTPANPIYLWQKVSQYSGRAAPFFLFAAQSDLGFTTHFEYCDIKRLINNKTPYDIPTILLLKTPRASLPWWNSSSFVSLLKRVPLLTATWKSWMVCLRTSTHLPFCWTFWGRTFECPFVMGLGGSVTHFIRNSDYI